MKKILQILVVSSIIGTTTVQAQAYITNAYLVISKSGNETKNIDTKFTVEVKDEIASFIYKSITFKETFGSNEDYTKSIDTISLLLVKKDFTISHIKLPYVEFEFLPNTVDKWNFDYHVVFKCVDGTMYKSQTSTLKVDTTKKKKFKEKFKLNIDIEDETDMNHKFMYLNAVDFDFTNNKTGYVGHLNMYSRPNTDRYLGFNAGLLKINYSNNDSIAMERDINVKINPLDELGVGSTYIRRYSEYKIKTVNRSFSIYFQPLWDTRLFKLRSKIYLHLHAELLISQSETTTTIKTIQQDTVTIATTSDIPMRVSETIKDKNINSTTLLNGYYGLGITLDLYLNKNSTLFLQPTLGKTTNYPKPASAGNRSPYYRVNADTKLNSFYLVRAHYRNKLSTNAELIIGTDIRGLFPRYDPQYAIYVGANIAVEKILDLFK